MYGTSATMSSFPSPLKSLAATELCVPKIPSVQVRVATPGYRCRAFVARKRHESSHGEAVLTA
jgi:hypothetical protein